MKQALKISVLFLILLFGFSCKRQHTVFTEINQNWQFRQSGKQDYLPATVPGFVHTDMYKNQIISDPYFGNNEKKIQWIGQSDWEYKTTFIADNETLEKEHIELIFEGIDTYSNIYLNDSLLLRTNNMFRKWEIDCKSRLNEGLNRLEIHFSSSEKYDSLQAVQHPIPLPDNRAYTRKAPYQSGWDWGPRFVSMGIWKPVYLRSWKDARIEDIQISQDCLKNDTAFITSWFEIESVKEQDCLLSVFDESGPELVNKKRVRLKKGINLVPIDFYISNPKLWWTKALGDQHLYHLSYMIQTNYSIDKKYKKLGVRTLEFVQQPDSIGTSFYFKLNGIPVFMKGANYIPQDNFPSKLKTGQYKRLIKSAISANMNMLRVWGGGIYEDDLFYELCDKNGILVWQDFMFACNMYPGDERFISNVKKEAEEQVKRLRNHPCIALWCGNNEIDEAWHNWEWQKSLGYSKTDSVKIWNDYQNLFENTLPEVVDLFSNNTPYISSSPKYGWGRDESLYHGDMHYWGVWWGEEPFGMYENKVGRFMSEYGFQGFPNMKSLNSCLDSSDLKLDSEALLNHQKHPRGMELIQSYMEREYNVPNGFEDYNYISQLLQAYGIKKAIEAHRRAKPACMGTLYWQLNDSWPVISWSGIDYYGRWKALHYFVKKAYAEYLISFEMKNDSLKVFVISDKLDEINAEFEISILDFKGEVFWSDTLNTNIVGNSSNIYLEKELSGFSKNDHLISAKLAINGEKLATNIYYFLPTKELLLPEPNIQKDIKKTKNGFLIRLTTDYLAKNIYLSMDSEGFFSDNYFDLLPGKNKEIELIVNNEISDIENKIEIKTISQTQ